MKEIKILVFKLDDEFFATDIMEVERILGYDKPTALPDVPEFFEGVINYEAGVLPIINLAKKFKFKENISDDKKIIVVKKERNKFGILVDSVSEVLSISEDDINASKEISSLISVRYITGIVKKDNNIIMLLNLDKILTLEEEEIIFQG
ncbi:chemotaxis protein CheW [Caproiciproducens sp. MSJ-32]|uniref:chemotaxis protein CheW n=1 Tax=Caproiciproducens sp. MSJ-32 TaxID=2841527 RepID=UPI001C11C611|nr:chemotaxis protein CheW [Caproiciproducens sp. MSJ-32]MBU5454630.1 chemotaxis protein CheW [Caproiciproducens sp. MSJ-32]